MEHITIANIEKDMKHILENKPMSCDNLEKLVLLGHAKKYISRMDTDFTEEDAKEWAKHMNPPARWTMDQTTAVMNQYGYHHKPCEFWVVMNALFSDYGKTLIKHGMDKPEIWAALAHDFIDDGDAVKDKVAKYWRDIVKH